MKTSTVMSTVLLSASCFAAPAHTARETLADYGGAAPQLRLNDAPVAPPAPDIPVATVSGAQHWQYITLPKSRQLDKTLTPELHLQT
jgi:hypothetical protein